jgi:hypothetical protein
MTSTRKTTIPCPGCSSATPAQTSASSLLLSRREHQETKEVNLYIPTSAGELVDKITIMSIRFVKSRESRGRSSHGVYNELRDLERCFEEMRSHLTTSEDTSILMLRDKLRVVNESLWDLEDDLRRGELRKDFGDSFVSNARCVYKTNDRRSEIKSQINELTKSVVKEYKNYAKYKEED